MNQYLEYIGRGTTVLMGFGGNDCSFDWKTMFFDADTEKTPNVAPDQFVSVYTDTIKKIQGAGATVIISNLPPIDAERHFEWISTQGPSRAIMKWLGDIGMLYRWHEMYNRLVEQIAGKTGCKLLDIRSPFLSNHNFKKLIGRDGMHPTEEGIRLN
ncbi:MAG: SGNH/GDSL hydrolase family protein [Clostridia bacterium]|nr:SGNH/GDSL hydrolase family protein [Clostridia bacterium]